MLKKSAPNNLKHLPTSLQYRYFDLKMGPLGKGSIAEKNEKFCWTLKQFLCDNGNPAPKSNRSLNSCFNYENTTHHLSLFTRVRVGFIWTSSACGTSAAGNRRYESGCSGTDESSRRSPATGCAGTATTCGELAAGAAAAASAARRTRRRRPTWSARCCDQSRSSRRNKSRSSRCYDSIYFSRSGKARWCFRQ